MPAYLIRHKTGQRGDIAINEPDLTLSLQQGWAVFTSAGSIALAVPADHIDSIQRIDPDDQAQSAPEG